MTLADLKKDVYRLIEEISPNAIGYTDDPDYREKFNTATNVVLNELDKLTSHVTLEEMEVKKGDEINLLEDLDNFRLLKKIDGVQYHNVDQYVTFDETGIAKIYYFTNKKQITSDTPDTYKFDVDYQTYDCLKYGVAADILLNDVSSNYGAYYKTRYNELKNELDPRLTQGMYNISGGVDI